jgi:kumamolisin
LIALINESLGRPIGFLNPLLYKRLANTKAFSDITVGNNSLNLRTGGGQIVKVKGYNAQVGWDCCTGLGCPNGENVLRALT